MSAHPGASQVRHATAPSCLDHQGVPEVRTAGACLPSSIVLRPWPRESAMDQVPPEDLASLCSQHHCHQYRGTCELKQLELAYWHPEVLCRKGFRYRHKAPHLCCGYLVRNDRGDKAGGFFFGRGRAAKSSRLALQGAGWRDRKDNRRSETGTMRPSPDIGPRSFEAWDTRSACWTFSGMVSPGESIRVPVSPTNMTRQATAVPTKRRSRMSMGTPLDLPKYGC
jgi:hypothetical protein